MKRVLITGTGGFIMSNFVRKAIYDKVPYEFISIDRIRESSGLNSIYANQNHEFIIADITDEHIINTIFEFKKPDIVIHAAADSLVDESLINSNKYIHNNVFGTNVIVNAAAKFGVQKFIYLSTCQVYGQLEKDTDSVWSETSKISPRNPYAMSKAAGELIVQTAGIVYGLNYNIVRLPNVYGMRQGIEKFIPKIIKSVLDNVPMTIYDDGRQVRDWLYVVDVYNALIAIIQNGIRNEVYNITANQEFCNVEIMNFICNALCKDNHKIEFVKDKRGSVHDFRYGMSNTKAKTLGWIPQWKFKDGILQTIDWYTKNKFFLK